MVWAHVRRFGWDAQLICNEATCALRWALVLLAPTTAQFAANACSRSGRTPTSRRFAAALLERTARRTLAGTEGAPELHATG